jgi:anti-sigma B factor antagonist
LDENIATFARLDGEGELALLVSGEIDLLTAQRLEREISSLLKQAPRSSVTVDLSGVTFIDASGLRALMAARREAGEAGRSIMLLDPSFVVQRLFEITGLEEHLGLRSASGTRNRT